MQTTPETAALLQELYDRASIVADLDGPQLEAWVSGLFPVFDTDISIGDFVAYCGDADSERGALLLAATAELAAGLDDATADLARARLDARLLPPWAAAIGGSKLAGAWTVTAPFGRSIVLGFVAESPPVPESTGDGARAATPADLRHSILVELDSDGMVEDLQLAGSPKVLLDEAAASDHRVRVEEMDHGDALAAIIAAWPRGDAAVLELGPGMAANQQFVRRRMLVASDHALGPVPVAPVEVDIRRGLDDREFADANRAALSTLQAAVGHPNEDVVANASVALVEGWVAVVTGAVVDVSPRESEALLWLEWADWLGAGIGLIRAGAGTPVDGAVLVDHVNRCPEVSSSIGKQDRDYAEWAFDIALDLLGDLAAVTEDRVLTDVGRHSLWVALVSAWSPADL